MISKITNVIPKKHTERVLNKCKTVCSYMKSESPSGEKASISAKHNLIDSGKVLLNKVKNGCKNILKSLTEESSSKRAGIDPLTEKERTKFIHDTSMYDPNSPDYIHGNYCVNPRK